MSYLINSFKEVCRRLNELETWVFSVCLHKLAKIIFRISNPYGIWSKIKAMFSFKRPVIFPQWQYMLQARSFVRMRIHQLSCKWNPHFPCRLAFAILAKSLTSGTSSCPPSQLPRGAYRSFAVQVTLSTVPDNPCWW